MLRNYLKVAWRNMMKNKVFSFINILGLSVGLTCCMLIMLYLWHETSYDTYQRNINRLYQVGTIFVSNNKEQRWATSPAPLAEVMQSVFPQIEATARIVPTVSEDKTLLQYQAPGGDIHSFYEEKGYLADSGFFRLFTYDFIEGDPASAITGPYSIVLSEEIALKIFGGQPALHKTIHVSSNTNGDHDYVVTGVFRPIKAPSHLDGRFFLSIYGGFFGDFLRSTTNLAQNNMFYTYLLLKPGADPGQLERQFPAFVDQYEGKELKEAGFYKKQFLLPVRDIHLRSGMNEDISPSGSVMYLYVLGSVALFTLLIACINFMNLATARSSRRMAEVGVRKALGARRSSMILQFLGESLLMALIAFAIAVCVTYAFLPGFERMANKDIQLSFAKAAGFGAIFLGLAIITGVVAGCYPAFYLSSFRPVSILKGKLTNSFALVSLRKGLVVFQFIISVVLIVASMVIGTQMSFLRHADLGFTKDQQLVLPLRSNASRAMYQSLKNELEKNPRVLGVGASLFYPGIGNSHDQLLFPEGKSAQEGFDTKLNVVDFGFLQTLQIKPEAGRLFSAEFPSDTLDGIILNEKATSLLGYTPGQAIGKTLYNNFQGKFVIVGVVKDFHFEDLHVPIGAFGFQVNSNPYYNYAIVHLQPGDMDEKLRFVEKTWRSLDPNEPFEYNFLDEQFQKNYNAEDRLSVIVGYFTIIAICISCLGLFGLAAFSAEQRTKEIGIRKVLGASATGIVILLSRDFLKLVGIAVLIASPLAWYIMNRWLQDFAYRTSISWKIFLLTLFISLIISLVTISFQAIRAAYRNPVESLKTD